MAKKLGVFGPRAEVLGAMDASDGEGPSDSGLPDQTLTIGSADWTPEQAEQYIDWRLQNLDTQIAALRTQLEELTALRKRWLAVTGGRSKMNGNGNGHTNGLTNGAAAL
jgi:hypothetical protein